MPHTFWVLVFPMIFAWQAVIEPLLMSELLTGWKCGGIQGGCVGCPKGRRMPASGYAPSPCAFGECLHPSSSKTDFAFKIMAPVLVVPVVYCSSCHTVTVGLLSPCSVCVEDKVWDWWIKPIQTVCYLCFENQGRAGKKALGYWRADITRCMLIAN